MYYKISKYNIEYDYSNGIILYNTLSNKLLPMSYNDYAIIETMTEHLSEFEKYYPLLFKAFQYAGFIIPSDFDELAFIRLQNKRSVFVNKNYHITINPTLGCNLKCWYCSTDYAGAIYDSKRMSDEIVENVKRHIEGLIFRHRCDSILLDWFGGEPLLYFNEVIHKISELANKLSNENNIPLYQQITTNATLLTEEHILKMKDMRFSFFQIPIDGNERRHNKIKFYNDKTGSYKDVIKNINLISEIIQDAKIILRVNFDKQTLKNIKDVFEDFSEKSKKNITVDFQKIWQINLNDKDSELLEKVKKDFSNAGFNVRLGSFKNNVFKSCYADNFNHYIINYDGRIFKCTAQDYSDRLVIGELQTSGEILWRESILSKMFEKASFENETCENCKKLPLCMGPCIQKNYELKTKNEKFFCPYKDDNTQLFSNIKAIAKERNLI